MNGSPSTLFGFFHVLILVEGIVLTARNAASPIRRMRTCTCTAGQCNCALSFATAPSRIHGSVCHPTTLKEYKTY
ncbi:hypothetical protein K445DRAFT_94070 [Daldinia sp. EC12]|nr:hypothetical protein K445DRAFT_94070 [Daldinia sp. EC12]